MNTRTSWLFFYFFCWNFIRKLRLNEIGKKNWNVTENLRKIVFKKWNFKHFKRRNWKENLKRRKRIFLEAKEIRKTRKLKEKNYSTDNRKNADSHSRQQRFGAIAQFLLNWNLFFTKMFIFNRNLAVRWLRFCVKPQNVGGNHWPILHINHYIWRTI